MLFAHFNCKMPALFPGCLLFMIQHHYPPYVPEWNRECISFSFCFFHRGPYMSARCLSSPSTGLLWVFIVTSKWPSPPRSLQNNPPHLLFQSGDRRCKHRGGLLHIFSRQQYNPLTMWGTGIQFSAQFESFRTFQLLDTKTGCLKHWSTSSYQVSMHVKVAYFSVSPLMVQV